MWCIALSARARTAAAHGATGRTPGWHGQDWFGLAAGSGAGQRFAVRPRADLAMRVAWRTSGSARRQPQETAQPCASLLPHQGAGRRRYVDGSSRPAVAGPPSAAERAKRRAGNGETGGEREAVHQLAAPRMAPSRPAGRIAAAPRVAGGAPVGNGTPG